MNYFFDVDGVLIKGFSNNPKLCNPWQKDLEKDLGLVHADMERLLFTRKFHDVATGKRPLHDAVQEYLDAVSSTVIPQDLIDYWFKKDTVLNHHIWDWLVEKKVVKERLFVATNQEKLRANYLWNDLNFKNTFTEIFYSGAIGYSKTYPGFFSYVQEKTGFKPMDCLLIDDAPEVIQAAQAFGWKTVLYEGEESLGAIETYL